MLAHVSGQAITSTYKHIRKKRITNKKRKTTTRRPATISRHGRHRVDTTTRLMKCLLPDPGVLIFISFPASLPRHLSVAHVIKLPSLPLHWRGGARPSSLSLSGLCFCTSPASPLKSNQLSLSLLMLMLMLMVCVCVCDRHLQTSFANCFLSLPFNLLPLPAPV